MPSLSQTIIDKTDSKLIGMKLKHDEKQNLGVFSIILFFAILLVVWLFLDNRLPGSDEAGHILNSYTYADLLRHPKFWRGEWLYKFFTVNQFYPPAIHIFNGFLKLLVGRERQADIISLVFFNIILSSSTYGIARLLTKSVLVGILSVIFVNTYPHLNYLSHIRLLDYPLIAMISLGLFMLIWWRKSPSIKRAVISGIAVGIACMSKQIAIFYLALPAIFYFALALKSDLSEKKLDETKQIFAFGLIASIICLPWILINAGSTHQTTSELASQISQSAKAPTILSNMGFYLTALPHMMSWLLFILLLLSLLITAKERRLLPAGLSIMGGFLSVNSLTCLFPREQYIAPLLVPCAIYSSTALHSMLKAQLQWKNLIIALVLIFTLIQFFAANFTPYPIPISSLIPNLTNAYPNHPYPAMDWGQEWVIKQIDAIDKKRSTWLNILSDTPEMNVHTFEFVAAKLRSPVKPTTSRYYTVIGDRLDFSEEKALYFQWYLFRSGNSGFPLKDSTSKINYQRLTNFVSHSGHFYLLAEKLLPDGTSISLYRQR